MNSLVFPVAVVGSIATALMIAAMLYFVWIAMGDEAHAPTPGDADAPELDTARDENDAELADQKAA
ncbi:hypothetical protein [Halorubrum sp. DTA98]|uniref:hypothetical protein n=1 Tax=Halorubrum sp. DTA98 TaxID=3402163 RepID=UPI003AAC9E5F